MAMSTMPVGLSRPPPIWPTAAWSRLKCSVNPCSPLVDQLLAVDYHERWSIMMRDDSAGHHRLAGSWGRDEHPELVVDQVGDGRGLPAP